MFLVEMPSMRLKIHLEFREEAAVTRSVFRAVFCVTLPTEGLCIEKGRDRETKLWGTPTFRSKRWGEVPSKNDQ